MTITTNRFYVYAFLRLDGSPYYIGKGTGDRIDSPTGRTWKLPPKDRRKILVGGLTESESFEYEIALISLLGRKDLGTGCLRNRTDGGEGMSGHVPSAEHRAKISTTKKGSKRSPAARAKTSATLKGKRHSPEARSKMSAAASNRSPEHLAKLSAANKGRPLGPEHRAKLSAAHKGHKHSPETLAKISAANAARHAANRAQREALGGQLSLLQEVAA